ncbi:XRE family transcriptional regulator [Clostridiaceae bacterium HSG29]|nr:XRE family transcriptional regulator [Clostridiaceae bacterium HSG29]
MISDKILNEIEEFIDNYLVDYLVMYESKMAYADSEEDFIDLETFIKNNKKPSFKEILFDFIDKKDLNDSVIYKKAMITRKHFSKIRCNDDYHPSKKTAIQFALALELNEKNCNSLLESASYTLSLNNEFDLIIKFCIQKKIYNLIDVNYALDYFNINPLGF